MKRTALFCLLLALLTGCTHTPDTPSPSAFPEAPGKADVENFYAAAARKIRRNMTILRNDFPELILKCRYASI